MTVRIAAVPPEFVVPATAYFRGKDGDVVAHCFDVVFRRVKTSERVALEQATAGGLTTSELLDRVTVGWRRMTDERGVEVPYTHAERMTAEEEYPGIEMAMAIAFWDHVWVDQRKAAEKNSGAPSDAA